MKLTTTTLIPLLASLISTSTAIDLTVGNVDSVCDAATDIIKGIMDYYEGDRYGGTVGMFQQPYYWWEAGLVFGGMIDTWKICNNYTYVSTIQNAINHQRGDYNDFNKVQNQSDVEANDDQVFWGFTVMEAAERNFPSYSNNSDDPNYAQLALNVYNSMAPRWDNETCGGGLRWQILKNMSGWNYKSEIANAGVFALGARIARYSNNSELVLSSNRILRWMKESSFITQPDGENYYNVYDGSNIVNDSCPVINGAIWSYNYALMTMGTSYLYSATGNDYWSNELDKFLSGIEHYFINPNSTDILYEYQCSVWGTCNNDQRAFRAIVANSLGNVAQLVPEYKDRVLKIINASAKGAAASCSGGSDGVTCGKDWSTGSWDGLYGLGEQISALEIIQNTVITDLELPCTDKSCGVEFDNSTYVTIPIPTTTIYLTNTNTVTETSYVTVSSDSNIFYTA
ncbi:hypothetical protein C6P40_001508 [Pichia californica]|uniref:Mannan endo-1,6-alpha-mannosidase n=1 Tax=Pichia californica TaxID=460514 RepID=A0A9P6WJE4_9ASCO|nr:hypothetical protein C6P42_001495 [[Candida] californica]KAG0688032.1 hypothetical protein C6P40_001508 [[Candida] californica]